MCDIVNVSLHLNTSTDYILVQVCIVHIRYYTYSVHRLAKFSSNNLPVALRTVKSTTRMEVERLTRKVMLMSAAPTTSGQPITYQRYNKPTIAMSGVAQITSMNSMAFYR